MNCKPGDLAVIVSGDMPEIVGRIVTCVRLLADDEHDSLGPHWEVDPPVTAPHPMRNGPCELAIADETLRPIRDPGDDAVDETLQWLPAPSREKETA